MELSRSTKILIGVVSIWPLIYIPLFMIYILSTFMWQPFPGGGAGFGPGFIVLMIVHMLTAFISLGMLIFYVLHAVKNEKITSDMRIVWILLFFFAGIFAQPIYWYLQVWKDDDTKPGQQGQLSEYRPAAWDAEFRETRTYQPPTEPPDWR
jgi:hypothetical protein